MLLREIKTKGNYPHLFEQAEQLAKLDQDRIFYNLLLQFVLLNYWGSSEVVYELCAQFYWTRHDNHGGKYGSYGASRDYMNMTSHLVFDHAIEHFKSTGTLPPRPQSKVAVQ